MRCLYCGYEIPPDATNCPGCDAAIDAGSSDEMVVTAPADILYDLNKNPESQVSSPTFSLKRDLFPSGNPVEELELVKGWNWGACIFTFIWAFAQGLSQIGLITMILSLVVPFAGIFVSVYLGSNGNELAWKQRKYGSVEEFKQIQKTWSTIGIIFMIVISIVLGIITYIAMDTILKSTKGVF